MQGRVAAIFQDRLRDFRLGAQKLSAQGAQRVLHVLKLSLEPGIPANDLLEHHALLRGRFPEDHPYTLIKGKTLLHKRSLVTGI